MAVERSNLDPCALNSLSEWPSVMVSQRRVTHTSLGRWELKRIWRKYGTPCASLKSAGTGSLFSMRNRGVKTDGVPWPSLSAWRTLAAEGVVTSSTTRNCRMTSSTNE